MIRASDVYQRLAFRWRRWRLRTDLNEYFANAHTVTRAIKRGELPGDDLGAGCVFGVAR